MKCRSRLNAATRKWELRRRNSRCDSIILYGKHETGRTVNYRLIVVKQKTGKSKKKNVSNKVKLNDGNSRILLLSLRFFFSPPKTVESWTPPPIKDENRRRAVLIVTRESSVKSSVPRNNERTIFFYDIFFSSRQVVSALQAHGGILFFFISPIVTRRYEKAPV